ncbi:WD domain, G-beta repeat [Gemmata sp. SH-PL17]|uniref:WD40 repeat domain-containing protein n=1 Tax=Gemmata sp. SH-PL17 TaxID=1630693 RepID=UPI00078DA44C|nr:WD40 repeat domain-containing protein [Gemmata sp. SH-PL17]AMV22764.1 WD domain, G-beta repeat [Gemmata sp. SH-PL17]
MSRAALSLALLFFAQIAPAADLPPGAVARLGDDRFRAGSAVTHLALSPDGKQFATAHDTGRGLVTVAVWNADTGRPVHEHIVNAKLFRGLVWGTSGAFAVACRAEPGPKGKIAKGFPDDFCVWDITDPKAGPPLVPSGVFIERISAQIHDARSEIYPAYTNFQFSADGARLAAQWQSADGKHAAHVFELKPADSTAKLTRVSVIDLGAEGANAVRISADGKTLITFRTLAEPGGTGGTEFTATAWDVATAKPARPVRVSSTAGPAPRAPKRDSGEILHRLMLVPDGRALVLHAAGEHQWGFDRADTGSRFKKRELIRRPYAPTETGAEKVGSCDTGAYAFSSSGETLVVAIDRETLVVDAFVGKELGRLEGHAHPVVAVAVSADGARIATADLYGLVRLWDAKSLRAIHDAPGHRAPIEHAELSPDGKRLLTSATDETVRLWDVATGKELRAFTGVPGRRRSGDEFSNCPTFTPDGTAIVFSTNDRLIARDLLTGLEVPLPGDMAKLKPRRAVFSPDGKAVLTWARDTGAVELWDWPGGKRRSEWDEMHSAHAPGFSSDGAAISLDQNSPKWWNTKTGKELPLSAAESQQFVFASPTALRTKSSDGRQVLQNDSGEVQICEVVTGQVRRELRGHRGSQYVLGFTPDGTKLLTAGWDHTILVWDVRLQSVPLPDALKKETSAAKLWDTLASGKADTAYLAMSRLAREPEAAVKIVRMRLKPAARSDRETDESRITDCRAVELLAALGTDTSRALLKELAAGHAGAFRTQEAKRAIERNKP